jgi:hypothetical protein
MYECTHGCFAELLPVLGVVLGLLGYVLLVCQGVDAYRDWRRDQWDASVDQREGAD